VYYSVLRTVICILTVATPYSSDIPSVGAYTTFYARNKSISDTKMMTNMQT